MRLLADECCDMAVVRALRGAGHDVLAIRESMPGAEDEAVVQLALKDDRRTIARRIHRTRLNADVLNRMRNAAKERP